MDAGVGGSLDEKFIGELLIAEAGWWMNGSSFSYSPGNRMAAAVPATITSKRIKMIIFSWGFLLGGKEKEERTWVGTNFVYCTRKDSLLKYVGLGKPWMPVHTTAPNSVTSLISPSFWGVPHQCLIPMVPMSQTSLRGSHKKEWRDFPGGPVAKTPCSQCRRPRFNLCLGN